MVTSIIRFKKLALLCATLVFLAVTGGGNIARAQAVTCQSPSIIKTVPIEINGCMFDVTVCMDCRVTTHYHATVKIIEAKQRYTSCVTGLTPDGITKAIYATIENPQYFFFFLCELDPDPGPCPGGINVDYWHHYCWDADWATDPQWGWDVIFWRPCQQGACIQTINWCWDGNQYIKTIVGRSYYGPPPTCPRDPNAHVPTGPNDDMNCTLMNWVCTE